MSAQSYEGAIEYFDTSRKIYKRKRYDEETNNYAETKRCLEALGVSTNVFDELCVIHVTGTKGKSSTVTMVESMLRNLNLKTGLFSFHVFKWNERIRINGVAISDETLAQYYWDIRNELLKKVLACDKLQR
ncbi:Folylpolyglutamate synthase, mitochondrial [Pseudolycoriella hygida]|uniref:Folylpolyglutamate synthase, mitochondrial n=1 Tax=Pseudolycoriella hygida TaxID=35572 RepID=A0A9Q0NDN2_9DIPT|nr:Folylpolyglutamate synthase, mitochondrial [Pseudolycoriella hygida]